MTEAKTLLIVVVAAFLTWIIAAHGYEHVRWVCVHTSTWRENEKGFPHLARDRTVCGFEDRYPRRHR